jgi:hypothetical protein
MVPIVRVGTVTRSGARHDTRGPPSGVSRTGRTAAPTGHGVSRGPLGIRTDAGLVSNEESTNGPTSDGFLERLGITDLATGLEVARQAKQMLIDAGTETLSGVTDPQMRHLVLMGFLARAQGLHEGVVWAAQVGNPYVAFGSLRSYAENAAGIAYVVDKPGALERFHKNPDAPGVPVGKLINHANKHFDRFAPIYHQLSQYAHPTPRSLMASHQLGEGGPGVNVRWSSVPAFKSEGDRLLACGWAHELAEATYYLLRRLGQGPAASPGQQ